MKGQNIITINAAAVTQAVQDYLDKHLTPPVKLTKFVPASQYEPFTYTATVDEITETGNPETQKSE